MIVAAAAFAMFPVGEIDIWWHLALGDHIWRHLGLPTHDPLSYTLPPTTSFHDTQWIFQATISAVFRIGGWSGLLLLRIALICGLAHTLWRWIRERGGSSTVALLTVTLILACSRPRFHLRPELAGFIALAAMLMLLDRGCRIGKFPFKSLLFAQWLWANLHASCVLGPGLSAAHAIGQVLTGWRTRSSDNTSLTNARRLALLTVALVAVTLINPFGWTMLTYGLTEKAKPYISEFQPPGWTVLRSAYMLYAAVMIIGIIAEGKRVNPAALIICAAFAFQSSRMVRFLPIFAIAGAPFLAQGWAVSLGRTAARPVMRAALAALLALACWSSVRFDDKPLMRTGANDQGMPVAAADFVLKHEPRGRIFHLSNHGGYLAWRLFPDYKVVAYNETKLHSRWLERIARASAPEEWRKMVEDCDASIAILPADYTLPSGATLARTFRAWPDWRTVFWDDEFLVLMKETAHPELYASPMRLSPEMIPFRSAGSAEEPVFLVESAAEREITDEFDRVLRSSPRHVRALLGLGLYHEKHRQIDAAVRSYAAAAKLEPSSSNAFAGMGRAQFQQGATESGLRNLERAVELSPSNREMLHNLAFAQRRAGKSQEAEKTERKIRQLEQP